MLIKLKCGILITSTRTKVKRKTRYKHRNGKKHQRVIHVQKISEERR